MCSDFQLSSKHILYQVVRIHYSEAKLISTGLSRGCADRMLCVRGSNSPHRSTVCTTVEALRGEMERVAKEGEKKKVGSMALTRKPIFRRCAQPSFCQKMKKEKRSEWKVVRGFWEKEWLHSLSGSVIGIADRYFTSQHPSDRVVIEAWKD